MAQSTQTQFSSTLQLERMPRQHPAELRAWSAADELISQYTLDTIPRSHTLAIFNDDFGAISCILNEYSQRWYSDSYLAHQALAHNRRHNQFPSQMAQDLTTPLQPADAWLIKIPKSLALFEYQLSQLSLIATPEQPIIFVAMVKFLTKGFFNLIEHYLGPVTTSLAQKKARLLFSHATLGPKPTSYPLSWSAKPDYPWEFHDHAGVFCLGKLDIGSRFLIEHLPDSNYQNIVDLGCGNGLLTLAALRRWPNANLTACDESFMAVASTMANVQHNYPEQYSHFTGRVDHALSNHPSASADLILCNPPFHQQQTISTYIAQTMFKDAYRCLGDQGELCVIANRHLPYAGLLKTIFKGVKVLASNSKFVILMAKKYHSRG
ncbi:methyltransferase [Celerinatantimonas sp. YJH-8]|uniref:methyltransferase n=1 Tax=Celerinatantimonas sp. YJH-8 TaxID=3228714 RepID=UPI0038BE8561